MQPKILPPGLCHVKRDAVHHHWTMARIEYPLTQTARLDCLGGAARLRHRSPTLSPRRKRCHNALFAASATEQSSDSSGRDAQRKLRKYGLTCCCNGQRSGNRKKEKPVWRVANCTLWPLRGTANIQTCQWSFRKPSDTAHGWTP